MTGPVRVMVVDDHPIVRSGLVGLLATDPDIKVAAEAENGALAVERYAHQPVDVVLMDLRMPVLDGVAATAKLLAADPKARVLVLTTYESDDQILAAIEAGASGYLLKAAPPDEIIAGIKAVADGSAALSPSVAAMLVSQVRAGAQPRVGDSASETLTQRELDVLTRVAAGETNRQIARALYIGEATVKSHLLRVFAKLEVSDRTRAVTRAQELGLL